jgi:hypothetical protein
MVPRLLSMAATAPLLAHWVLAGQRQTQAHGAAWDRGEPWGVATTAIGKATRAGHPGPRLAVACHHR